MKVLESLRTRIRRAFRPVRRPDSRLGFAFVAAIYLGTRVTGVGFVLCLGSHGHVALEAEGQDCCGASVCREAAAAEPTPAAADGAFVSPARGDCGECTDIPLSADPASRRHTTQGTSRTAGKSLEALASPDSILGFVHFAADTSRILSGRDRGPSPLGFGTPLHLRL